MDPKKDIPNKDVRPGDVNVTASEVPVQSEQPGVATIGPKRNIHKKLILIIVAVVALLAIVGGIAMISSKPSDDTSKSTVSTETKQAVEVTITDAGFSPSTLIIKSGTVVTWRNATNSPKQVGSNPYPDHSSLPGLYSENPIVPGGTYSYTFTNVGKWGYTDYTKPTLTGSVVVQ